MKNEIKSGFEFDVGFVFLALVSLFRTTLEVVTPLEYGEY